MPQLVIEVVADPRKLTKGLTEATRTTKRFGREMESASRGVIAGTLSLHGLGRSLAFASGGFIAFAGATRFLRESVDAAREAGVAQRSLAAQMRASGESFKQNQERIEQTALSYGKFGFQNDEVVQSLTVLERATGKINAALALQQGVADLARARQISLAQAAAIVGKVFGGQETALRRAVPGLEKNAHGVKLIEEAFAKLRGQAAANTTAAERFQAVLHDTQEIIGTTLLPILNRLLDRFSKWLERMNRTGELRARMDQVTGAFRRAYGVLSGVVGLLGGWGQALTLAVGAWAGFKIAGIASAQAVAAANLVAAGVVEKAWQAALISTGWGILAAAAGAAAAYIITHWEKVKAWFAEFWIWLETEADKTALAVVEPFSHLPAFLGGWARDAKTAIQADLGYLQDELVKTEQAAQSAGKKTGDAFKLPKFDTPGFGALKGLGGGGAAAKGFALPYRLQLEQAEAEASGVQARIVQAARDIAAFIRRILPRLKGQKLLDAYGLLSQANQTITSAAQAAAEKARQAAEKARQARMQFDLSPALQLAQARADALAAGIPNLQGATRLQLSLARQAKAAALKAINSHKLLYQGLIDAWNVVAQANQTLAQSMKGGIQNTYAAVSTRAVTEGLQLTRLQRLALEERLAQRAAHGGFAPIAGAALGQPIHVTTHVTLDGRVVATSVEKHNRQTHQRRGTRR